MNILDDIKKLVIEYESKYRNPSLEPFIFIEKFNLVTENPKCPPIAAKKGVYAIFNKDDEIIYLGKSSAQKKAIWHRINDHIYSAKKSAWFSEPRYFCGWAVPDESFFEASALEEFLIFKLRNKLPNNRVGK